MDAFINDRKAEVISQLAYPLPLEVALFLIGVPKEDMAFTKKLSDRTSMLVNSPLPEEQQVECARDFVTFQHYFIGLVNERRSAPREDLISDLLETPAGERPFDDTQFANLLTSMEIAGHETTTQLIGNGLALLLEHPESCKSQFLHPEPIRQPTKKTFPYT